MNIPNWLRSSQDPDRISLTIKGAVVFVPAIVLLGSCFGFAVNADNLLRVVNEAAVVGSAIVTFWGLVRKLFTATPKP